MATEKRDSIYLNDAIHENFNRQDYIIYGQNLDDEERESKLLPWLLAPLAIKRLLIDSWTIPLITKLAESKSKFKKYLGLFLQSLLLPGNVSGFHKKHEPLANFRRKSIAFHILALLVAPVAIKGFGLNFTEIFIKNFNNIGLGHAAEVFTTGISNAVTNSPLLSKLSITPEVVVAFTVFAIVSTVCNLLPELFKGLLGKEVPPHPALKLNESSEDSEEVANAGFLSNFIYCCCPCLRPNSDSGLVLATDDDEIDLVEDAEKFRERNKEQVTYEIEELTTNNPNNNSGGEPITYETPLHIG